MTRLQEVEKLLDNNLQLITDYTKRVAELEKEHWNKCRQIAHYSDELRRTKELLKAAVDDINYYVDCYEAHCGECCCDQNNHCHWKHEAEALALIGGETDEQI